MRIQELLAENSGNVRSLFGGDLCLIVLHGSGVSGFALIGSGLGSLTGGGNSSNISVGFRLSSLRGGHHGSNVGVSFCLGFLRGSHHSGGVSGFLRGDLLLICLYSTGISGFTLIGSSSESYDSLSEGANAFRMKYSRMLNAFGSPK